MPAGSSCTGGFLDLEDRLAAQAGENINAVKEAEILVRRLPAYVSFNHYKTVKPWMVCSFCASQAFEPDDDTIYKLADSSME